MNNQEFEKYMDRLYGPVINSDMWWASQTMRNSSIQYLISKGFTKKKSISKWQWDFENDNKKKKDR